MRQVEEGCERKGKGEGGGGTEGERQVDVGEEGKEKKAHTCIYSYVCIYIHVCVPLKCMCIRISIHVCIKLATCEHTSKLYVP